MNHGSVGEALSGDYSRTRGAERLARLDAEVSERLARQANTEWQTDPLDGLCACGEPLPPKNTSGQCERCRKRAFMRTFRKAKPGPAHKVREPKSCAICKAMYPWARNRTLCAVCQAKPWRWRSAQYRLLGIKTNEGRAA